MLSDGRVRLFPTDISADYGSLWAGLALWWLGLGILWLIFADDTVTRVVGLLAALLGGWAISGAVVQWNARRMAAKRIGRATLTLPRWPLRLGETFCVRFKQRVLSPCRIEKVTVTLECEEFHLYTYGTQDRTGTAVNTVHSSVVETLQGTDAARRRPLNADITLRIPADAMHSFRATQNWYRWVIHVHTAIDRCPDYDANYALVVEPELDDSAELIVPRSNAHDKQDAAASIELEPGPLGGENADVWPVGSTLHGSLMLSPDAPFACKVARIMLEWYAVSDEGDHGVEDTVDLDLPMRESMKGRELSLSLRVPQAGPITHDGKEVHICWHVTAELGKEGHPSQAVSRTIRVVPAMRDSMNGVALSGC